MSKRILFPLTAVALLGCATAMAGPTFYGSIRTQIEYVDPDNVDGNFDRYLGVRDAYSRIGVKIEETVVEDWSLLAQLELPLDTGNLMHQDPYNHGVHERIYKLQLSGPLGTVWAGQSWMPYYNAIAAPMDQFSSYYSGFGTFTGFRMGDTISYATPVYQGVKVAAALSGDNGYNGSDRAQLAVSYKNEGLSVNAGIDNPDGADSSRIYGLAVSYALGPWRFAAKREFFDSDNDADVFGQDGSKASNLLVQYTSGNNTFRGMYADVDNYGERVFHAGWDHKYNDNLKVFLEYYSEEETVAIAGSGDTTSVGHAATNRADSGGKAVLTGIRYDFSL